MEEHDTAVRGLCLGPGIGPAVLNREAEVLSGEYAV